MKTTIYSVLCIAIRIGAVLMAVGIVERVPDIFYFADGGSYATGALWFSGAGLFLAFMLWLSPNLLARWAIGRGSHEVLDILLDVGQIQYLAFSIVGVWVFIDGITGLVVRTVTMLVVAHRSAYGDVTRVLTADDWYWLIDHLATAIVGVCLLLGSRGLVRVLHRVRGYPSQIEREVMDDANTTQDG